MKRPCSGTLWRLDAYKENISDPSDSCADVLTKKMRVEKRVGYLMRG